MARVILTLLLIMFPLSSALACDGFKNSMSALENALLERQESQPVVQESAQGGPPIAAINQSLDELEAVLQAHAQSQASQTPLQSSEKHL